MITESWLKNHKPLIFCKDHRDKLEVPDPLTVEDLISFKFKNRRKSARLITQYFRLLKNHAFWDRAYLYSPYKEISPGGGGGQKARVN